MTALDEAHRTAQLAVRASALRALVPLWPALDLARVDETYPAWARAVGAVVAQHRTVSSSVAGTYLQQLWSQLGIDSAELVLAPPVVGDQLATSLFVTTVVNYRSSLGRQVDPKLAADRAFVASSGSASRLVLDAGRDTVLQTARADRRRPRFARVTGPGACTFCSMLAGRGAVYASDTVRFHAHDHCSCSASLAY